MLKLNKVNQGPVLAKGDDGFQIGKNPDGTGGTITYNDGNNVYSAGGSLSNGGSVNVKYQNNNCC